MATSVLWGSYTFPITPTVLVDREWQHDEENRKTSYLETWRLTGYLAGDGATAIQALLDTMLAALGSDFQDLLFKDGAATIRSMTSAAARRGPVVMRIAAPREGQVAEYATHLPYEIEIQGEIPDSDNADTDILHDRQTITFSTDQDRITTKTIQGTLKVIDGVDVTTKVLARDPGFSVPPGETASAFIRTRYEISDLSEDLTECSYTFEHVELWKALPSNVTSGDYSTQTSINAQGMATTTISGEWVGDGAEAAAVALRPAGPLIADDITLNEHLNSASFTFTYEGHTDNDLLEYSEDIEYREPYEMRKFWTRAEAGKIPYRQDVGLSPAFISQRGRAIGRTVRPTAPEPLFPDDHYGHPTKSKASALRGADGQLHRFGVTWNYSFAFADEQEHPEPANTLT